SHPVDHHLPLLLGSHVPPFPLPDERLPGVPERVPPAVQLRDRRPADGLRLPRQHPGVPGGVAARLPPARRSRGRGGLLPGSAAHVLVAFQTWLLITLGFAIAAGIVLAVVAAITGGGTHAEQSWAGPLVIATLLIQNIAMGGVVLYTVLVLYDQRPIAAGLS